MSKASKKIIVLAMCAIFIALSVIIISLLITKLRIFCIGFYQLPDNYQKSLVNYMQTTMIKENGKPLEFGIITFNADEPLEPQLKKNPVDLLFMYANKTSEEIANQNHVRISDDIFSTTFSTMRKVSKNQVVPILMDHFELLSKTGTSDSFDNLIMHIKATKQPDKQPIIFAGKNDKTLLQFVTMMVETRTGEKGYNKLVDAIENTDNFSSLLETELTDNYTFASILDEIISLKSKQLFYSETLNLTESDVMFFIDNKIADIVFLPLSAHRKSSPKALINYTSHFVPAGHKTNNRALLAPLVVAIPLTDKEFLKDQTSVEIIKDILNAQNQKQISTATGLAPVNSIAKTADKQATDVRIWVASASSAICDIGSAAYTDPKDAKQLASKIREYIRSNGLIK